MYASKGSVQASSVFEPNPQQQGLKHGSRCEPLEMKGCLRTQSTTTRIETGTQGSLTGGYFLVFEPNPQQQGLKPGPDRAAVFRSGGVFEPNPQQQGLKLR